MPIEDETELRALLSQNRITALTVDTSIFDQKGLRLDSGTLGTLSGLKDRPIDFVLSDTVAKEVRAHLRDAAANALRDAKRALGSALDAFDTRKPERDDLLRQVTGGLDPEHAAERTAERRWTDFIDRTGCKVLDDAELVETATLFEGYFAGDPPFGTGQKKNEFPDALALHALERAAVTRGRDGILVVSKDRDWRAFCERSERLYLVPEIEKALALVTDAPLGLRRAIHLWLVMGGEGHEEVRHDIENQVERFGFSADAHSSSGEVEVSTWGGALQNIKWPEEAEIDIIDVQGGDDAMRVVASLPLDLAVSVQVELNFSVWDSVDRESVGLNDRLVVVDREFTVRATVTLDVHDHGSEDQAFELVEGELENRFYEVNLGEVDVFEPEDYYDEE